MPIEFHDLRNMSSPHPWWVKTLAQSEGLLDGSVWLKAIASAFASIAAFGGPCPLNSLPCGEMACLLES